jgi:outer membrane murein-binding lipoprotein Lpp
MTLRSLPGVVGLVVAFFASGCAPTRIDRRAAERQRLESTAAALSATLDSLRLAYDALRLDAARLQFEVLDRDEEIRALRLELERLKAIDLKPKRPAPHP